MCIAVDGELGLLLNPQEVFIEISEIERGFDIYQSNTLYHHKSCCHFLLGRLV